LHSLSRTCFGALLYFWIMLQHNAVVTIIIVQLYQQAV